MEDYTKPFLSLPAMVIKLRDRGMVCDDPDKAVHYLAKIGYYRLSGYWYAFRRSTTILQNGVNQTVIHEDFRGGITFKNAVELYVFDKRLRMLMLDVLERIEIALRADIVQTLGRKDRWAHRKSSYFDASFSTRVRSKSRQTAFAEYMEILTKVEARAADKEDFVIHFRAKYRQPLPIWAALELLDFGALSTIYSGMQYRDKLAISRRYGISDPIMMSSWIRTLAFTRNICAHHSRLWNKPLVSEPSKPKLGDVPNLDVLAGDAYVRKRFFASASIARYLQLKISPDSTWGRRFVNHISTFPTIDGISLRNAGFPDGWETLPLWRI